MCPRLDDEKKEGVGGGELDSKILRAEVVEEERQNHPGVEGQYFEDGLGQDQAPGRTHHIREEVAGHVMCVLCLLSHFLEEET